MKKVFSTIDDCVHRYAQFTQSEGRAGSVYFSDTDFLYSYGTHFPLAARIDTPSGTVVMLNIRSYSNTTSKHQRITEQAIPSHYRTLNAFYLPSSRWEAQQFNHERNLKQWQQIADEGMKKHGTGRTEATRRHYLSAADNAADSAAEYCDVFQIEKPDFIESVKSYAASQEAQNFIFYGKLGRNLTPEERKKKAIKAQREREARERREAEAEARKYQIAVDKFLSGEASRLEIPYRVTRRYYHNERPKYDILRTEGEQVRTSQSVTLTTGQAITIYKAIISGAVTIGAHLQTNNGTFEVVRMDSKDIVIGCHCFDIAYLVFFGESLLTNQNTEA